MNAEAMQASLAIEAVAKAVANWTVDQHAQANPQIASRYGDAWRADWIGHTLSQIQILAQSMAVRRPEVFAAGARWTSEAFHSQGVDKADLILNTNCLRDVLCEELSPPIVNLAVAHIDAAIEALNLPDADINANDAPNAGHKEFILGYIKAILEGDRPAAESIILTTCDNGVSISEIYEEILAPAQTRLGQMWHRGEITVADEHFGSATTQGIMSQLRSRWQRASPKKHSVVGTSTPGDHHEIGVRMVSDLFELDGWNAIYLGANTPLGDVLEIIERRQANLLALSVGTYLKLRDAGVLIDNVRASSVITRTKILVGGRPFTDVQDLWQELGADGWASSAQDAVKVGNRLVSP